MGQLAELTRQSGPAPVVTADSANAFLGGAGTVANILTGNIVPKVRDAARELAAGRQSMRYKKT